MNCGKPSLVHMKSDSNLNFLLSSLFQHVAENLTVAQTRYKLSFSSNTNSTNTVDTFSRFASILEMSSFQIKMISIESNIQLV